MTTKQYLNQIARINRMINNKLAEIYQLKTMVCSISVSMNEDKVQTSQGNDILGNSVAKIIDLENEINKAIDAYVNKKEQIISQIDSIQDIMEYQVLFSRYIEFKTFEQIAVDNNYSVRQILRIHGNALVEFEKKFGQEYLCH